MLQCAGLLSTPVPGVRIPHRLAASFLLNISQSDLRGGLFWGVEGGKWHFSDSSHNTDAFCVSSHCTRLLVCSKGGMKSHCHTAREEGVEGTPCPWAWHAFGTELLLARPPCKGQHHFTTEKESFR